MKRDRFQGLVWLAVWSMAVGGCRQTAEEPVGGGTVFDPPAWVDALDQAVTPPGYGDGTSSGDPTPGESFHGLKTTVAGVAEPLIVPETNVVVTNGAVTNNLTAVGFGNDPDTQVTLSMTVLANVAPPDSLNVVVGPPTDPGEVSLFYSETATNAPANSVTGIASGTLDLDRWSDVQVKGTFSATLYLQDGSERTLADGVIDVRTGQE